MLVIILNFFFTTLIKSKSIYSILNINEPEASPTLNINFANDYSSYDLVVSDTKWVSSGLTSFRNNGDWSTLTIKSTTTQNGTDTYGYYSEFKITYIDTNNYLFDTHFRIYPNMDDLIILTQTFPNGTKSSKAKSNDDVISSFPSFLVSNDDGILGYAHWQGSMSGSATHVGGFNNGTTGFIGGIENTAPLALFTETNCVVISALTDHMAINDMLYGDTNGAREIRWGLLGGIDEIPEHFSVSFIISGNSNSYGINDAMTKWGDRQLQYYGKQRGNAHIRDYTLQYLGYSTDNGAYYYYWTEPNKNYQETIIDIKKYTVDQLKIPVKYVLLDSWWYYKGNGNGVKNWTAMPSIFPDGMEYVYKNTGWLIQAHNRYFSTDNDYRDIYPFTCTTSDCLPLTDSFWEYLFDINENWGLTVYEQDWESTSEDDTTLLLNTTWFGKEWLSQMNNAAMNHHLSIQYCMDFPRHLMTSVGLFAVTQARASGDYHPGNDQWKIGLSSIFTDAIDIAPSKDNYWSVPYATTTKSHYNIGTIEPYNRLQSLVLSLSNGPVAFSDQIGFTDKNLIMKHCNQDGLLLRPDKSATMIDSYFYINGQLSNAVGPNGQVWSTHSIIGRNEEQRYLYAFTAELNKDYKIYPSNLNIHATNNTYLGYEYNTTNVYTLFDKNNGITLKACFKYDFQYYTFIPININNMNKWYLQGELSKWITVSQQRFLSINDVDTNGAINVIVKGAENENINIAFVQPSTKKQVIVNCVIGSSLQAVIRMPAATCNPY